MRNWTVKSYLWSAGSVDRKLLCDFCTSTSGICTHAQTSKRHFKRARVRTPFSRLWRLRHVWKQTNGREEMLGAIFPRVMETGSMFSILHDRDHSERFGGPVVHAWYISPPFHIFTEYPKLSIPDPDPGFFPYLLEENLPWRNKPSNEAKTDLYVCGFA